MCIGIKSIRKVLTTPYGHTNYLKPFYKNDFHSTKDILGSRYNLDCVLLSLLLNYNFQLPIFKFVLIM